VHRKGLKFDKSNRPPIPRKPKEARAVVPRQLQLVTPDYKNARTANDNNSPPSGPILFRDRLSNQCSWPLWNDRTPADNRMCCGQPVVTAGSPWCQGHKNIGTRERIRRA
jgi:hypothetical protein